MTCARVCVIGAGAAGLSAAHHLAESPEKFTFTVFEQTDEIGGTWVYTEETDCDEYGLPIHSSMYTDLRTNLPKEIMSFIDHKFEDSAESFVHHTTVLRYLKSYCEKYGLHQYIKFRTHVTEVRPVDRNCGKAWSVTVQDLSSKEVKIEEFDAVIVCNGHFSKPYIPSIPGIEGFHGICLHSHVYRNPIHYTDKKVIILGASSSGIDICLEVSKHAKQVFLSHNLPPLGETADRIMQGACHVFSNQSEARKLSRILPCNVTQVAGIDSFAGDAFILRDGAECSAEVVIFCTGYEYDFPFLHSSCGVRVKDKRISPLYKHIIHIEFPTLCFIGLPFSVIPFPVFDYQVMFFLKMLDKVVMLPSKENMYADTERDLKERLAKGIPVRHFHKLAAMQWDYLEQLAASSGVQPLPQVVRKIYEKTADLRKSDLLNYKNFNFRITNDNSYELCH